MPGAKRPDDVRSEDLNYPDTLRITIETGEDAFDRALDAAERAERGEQPPATVSFKSADQFRRLLTDRRLEVLRSLMAEPAESITALAERLGRSYSVVHEDVDLLAEYGIVEYRRDGRTKQPFVPYETVEFDVTVRAASPTDSDEAAV